jgi:hypothetical protein
MPSWLWQTLVSSGLIAIGYLLRQMLAEMRKHRGMHDDVWKLLGVLTSEQADEKWRLHRIEKKVGVDEPPPRNDSRTLYEQLSRHRG